MSESLTFQILGRPVPAVRTTGKQMFKDPRYKKYSNYKDRIRDVVWGKVLEKYGKVIQVKCPFKISGIICVHQHLGDIDNYLKSILDGLQKSKFIKNDKQCNGIEKLYLYPVDSEDKEGIVFTMTWE